MKKFRLTLEENMEPEYGISMISMVNDPATKHLYVALKEQQKEQVFLSADMKKGTVTGALMVPELEITRFDTTTKKPYTIEFPAETIELASQDFMKKNLGHSINIEHSLGVEEVYVTEAWIKADEVHDKSVALGVEAPVGSMMVTLKVENQEVREELVETGLLTGFSIEGLFKKELIEDTEVALATENQKYMKTKKKSVITQIKELVNGTPDETVELEAVAEVSYWWQDVVDGTTYELNDRVMRKPYSDDDEPYPIGAGEYQTEEGTRILTDKQGYIRYIFPAVVVEVPKEEVEEPAVAVAMSTETDPAPAVEAPVAETEKAVQETTPAPTPEAVTEPAPTVAGVAETIAEKVVEEVPMVPHTDTERPMAVKKVKWDGKMTAQERIKANFEANKEFVK